MLSHFNWGKLSHNYIHFKLFTMVCIYFVTLCCMNIHPPGWTFNENKLLKEPNTIANKILTVWFLRHAFSANKLQCTFLPWFIDFWVLLSAFHLSFQTLSLLQGLILQMWSLSPAFPPQCVLRNEACDFHFNHNI